MTGIEKRFHPYISDEEWTDGLGLGDLWVVKDGVATLRGDPECKRSERLILNSPGRTWVWLGDGGEGEKNVS